MGTKLNPGKFDCYDNALPDEPVFVLLARDPDFKDVVEYWAWKRLQRLRHAEVPQDDQEAIEEALGCAVVGDRWRKDNMGKWRKDDGG